MLLELCRGFLANFLAVRAARHLHATMLGKLLRCVLPLMNCLSSSSTRCSILALICLESVALKRLLTCYSGQTLVVCLVISGR